MDLTAIIQAIIAIIAAVVSTFLIPWLQTKVNENQLNLIQLSVQYAVKAAEQLYNTGQGQQKKQYVIDYLKSKGYTIDDAVIEATVNTYFGKTEKIAGEFAEVE